MATHFNRSTKLSDSLKATASSSNVTSSTVWGLANQPSVNGAVTQWNLGAESVVPSEMKQTKVMMKWIYRKKFSFSISEMKITVISWEAATQARISVKVIFVYRKIFLTQIKLQRHSLQTKQLQLSSPAPQKPPFLLWLLLALSWCLSICAHCSATTRKNGCNHQKWCLRWLAPPPRLQFSTTLKSLTTILWLRERFPPTNGRRKFQNWNLVFSLIIYLKHESILIKFLVEISLAFKTT